MKNSFLIFFFIGFISFLQGQYSVCGSVSEGNLPGADVEIVILETDASVFSDTSGNFCFSGIAAGDYSVRAYALDGRESEIYRIRVSEDIQDFEIQFQITNLETVVIKGRYDASDEAKDHSIKTEVIDLRQQTESPVSVERLMNRSSGIRIRNTGGLGAEADVVVGGFNGKSIKFLKDGIPIDYLGSSAGLTKLPLGSADYIEVYKGVMPTEVGIDALGGAVNIISGQSDKTSSRISYEFGSFNTHRLGINSFVRNSDKFSYGLNLFVDYSDNDFKVDNLPLANKETGRTDYIRTKLFHNAYYQNSGEAFVNFEKRNWADLLKIKVNSFTLKRDIQNDFASRSRAFGEVYRKEKGMLIPSVEYKKRVFDNRLQISQFLVYSSITNELTDAAKNIRYDWLGNAHETVSGSEMGIDLSKIKNSTIKTILNNLTYRGLFDYKIGENQKLILNLVNNYFLRKSDNLSSYDSETNIKYNRTIVGLGYQYGLFQNRMEGLSQIKYLRSRTHGNLIDEITQKEQSPVNNSGWSLAQSLKYSFTGGWLVRASVENTYRLPDQMEIFGDNIFIIPNLELKPEKSLNVNLGIRFQKRRHYRFEVNTYWRDVKDLIRLKDITQFTSVFLNLDNVRGYGVELEGMARIFKGFELSGNLTYNEFRFKGSNKNISNNEHFIDARVSNMPFYFGNLTADYRFENFLKEKDELRLYWNFSYVHQYYLDFIEKQYEPSGFLGLFGSSKIHTNRVIPIQKVHSAGLVWIKQLKSGKQLAWSFDLNNIFDESVYNAFKMQSAGRGFSTKISFEF